jgi:uncharacterized membrane protein
MTLAIFAAISLIILLIQAAVPFLVKRTVVFGVTIPERHIREPLLAAFKKRYAAAVLLLTLIGLGAYCFWVLGSSPAEEQVVLVGTCIQLGIIAVSLSLYFYFHARTVQAKKMNRWYDNLKQIKIADLSIRTRDEMLPWHVFLLPILITAGIIGYTILKYDVLPDQIPTHWGINGEPDAFTAKTPVSAVSRPVFLLVMQIMILAIHSATKSSGVKLSATARQASRVRQLMLRKYTSWLLFLVSLAVTVLFSFFQLNMIHPDLFDQSIMVASPMIFLAATLAGTVFYAFRVGRCDKVAVELADESVADYDEDAHWIGGILYFNRNDPSIFVEKRFGVGWTLNFGNPIGYLIVLIPLAIMLILTFFL